MSSTAVHHPELFESHSFLDERHNQILDRAVRNVLSTDVAELAYAQILDGLPLADTYNNVFPWVADHPVNDPFHDELCPGVLEQARQFRKDFILSQLRLQQKRIKMLTKCPAPRGIQEAEDGSEQFKFRLIELVAVACHQVGSHLYELDSGPHPHSLYEKWHRKVTEERNSGVQSRRYTYSSKSVFSHRAFQVSPQYPRGFADTAGYWAEGQVFGGVIIFDRGESENECRSLWMHSDLRAGPSTLFPPTNEQFSAIVSFLLADLEQDKIECPFPIRAIDENRPRWDPDRAFTEFNIFRDRYEKTTVGKPPPPRDVKEAKDWPELGDNLVIMNGTPLFTDEQVARAEANIWNITPTSPLWGNYLATKDSREQEERDEVLEEFPNPPTL